MKLFAFTLDLEADYAGLVDEYEIFGDTSGIEKVLSTLSSLGVKITVFTVCEILEKYPHIIELFEKYECEFEPHSYSHDLNNSDSEFEIIQARKAYNKYFKREPRGYRAPRGIISDSGIKHLEKNGFCYDSSIFPSYFPNPFRYLFCNKEVHYYKNSGIMEIPFTSVTPFRLTLSLSYIKLFGLSFFTKPPLPEIVCFDSHLHDLIQNRESYSKLPLLWKLIYYRNKDRGLDICVQFLERVKQNGFKFCYMSEIYDLHKK